MRVQEMFFADRNLSSTELESGNAIGACLQTSAPVLDKISGPMGARFLSSTGLGSGNLIERERESAILPSTGTGYPKNLSSLFLGDNLQRLKSPENRK